MKKLTSSEIRQMFLDFFKEKGHQVEPSASLVPKDDPTLLWINSGVATLKKYFDGTLVPENPRIVNVQKSIRTNDIENVGFTPRHHTFFEMLGNFSIGDYFKKEAIEWAWEFLTSEKWLALDKDLLFVTVHPEDDEAYDIWLHDIQIPQERIIRLEENFWDIGVGPSGPNTEIFYDRGEAYGNDPNDPELYPGGENNRYLEIWNLVFSQFNHNPDDTYTPLPNKNIDTGMGLERITSIIQGVPTNFETDLFMPIIKKIEQLANVKYGDDQEKDIAFKVIADHIRTVVFAIGDGALPSNEGRGYVLRRLLRRAVRFAKQIGIEKPFMHELVEVVGEIMQQGYPEVLKQKDDIQRIIKLEEDRFHETLQEGLTLLSSVITEQKEQNNTVIPGEQVFKLYDTYGFPKELTEEYAADHGLGIDEEGFYQEMEKQRERARSAREHVDSMNVQGQLLASLDTSSEFVGYHQLSVKTNVVNLIKDDQFVEEISAPSEVYAILAETPFYAESGGQVADQGWLINEQLIAKVKDVQTGPNGQHIHHIVIEKGTLSIEDEITAMVDDEKRSGIIKNHTATHLLHKALQDILGSHVTQAGSLVTNTHLRFDFNHFEAVTDEQLKEIEQTVNEKIWQQLPILIDYMPIDDAKQMGAMALFGEKYGDIVRVVQIDDYSIELCGGCHVNNTSEIGLFKIIGESGIGAGVRRIEAVTSKGAYQFLNEKMELLTKSAQLLKTNEEDVIDRIERLFAEISDLEKANQSLSAKMAHFETSSILNQVDKVEGINIVAEQVSAIDMNQLRNMVDEFKQKLDSGVILLAAENNGKVLLAAGVTKDLMDQGFHAGKLIKEAATICGGGGGGRPDMAQAGGKDPAKIKQALAYTKEYVADQLNK